MQSQDALFKEFSVYYKSKTSGLDKWLAKCSNNKLEKSNEESQIIRNTGNKYFAKRDYKSCIFYYTKSLCFALDDNESYGKALANRSAAYFELRCYKNSLIDIESCFTTNYPKNLYLKILIRKCECLFYLNETQKLSEAFETLKDFLKDASELDERKCDLRKLSEKYFTSDIRSVTNPNMVLLVSLEPKVSDGIEFRQNKKSYRQVVATRNLERGEVLLVEKAVFFGPIFEPEKTKGELRYDKCYFCLKDTENCIPCKSCTVCVYCNEGCRNDSWIDIHCWECEAMKASIWYELDVAFPAFKALVQCRDPSKYSKINELADHLNDMESIGLFFNLGAKTVKYLEKCTSFFSWLVDKSIFPYNNLPDIMSCTGALLIKHMSQIMTNSCLIRHSFNDLKKWPEAVACGLFQAFSLMNHSCKPIVTTMYVEDTVIIKALEDISAGQEVFNCYGIDYRYHDRAFRQKELKDRHFFTCRCVICRDPSQEIERLDRLNLNADVADLLEFTKIIDALDLEDERNLKQALHIASKLYSENHENLLDAHEHLYGYYLHCGLFDEALNYFDTYLKILSRRTGKYSRKVGLDIFIFLSTFAENENLKINNKEDEKIVQKVYKLYERCENNSKTLICILKMKNV